MLYRIVVLFVCMLISFKSYTQTLNGKVVGVADTLTETLPYASVYWINTNVGTSTDSLGEFKITLNNITDKRLVVSILGYLSDTVSVKNDNYLIVLPISVCASSCMTRSSKYIYYIFCFMF